MAHLREGRSGHLVAIVGDCYLRFTPINLVDRLDHVHLGLLSYLFRAFYDILPGGCFDSDH